MYSKSKLSNGATLITVPVKGTEALTVLALFPVGSRYEKEKLGGVSHFIEHMMFKGTQRRPTTLDISKEVDSVGAEFNAYTGRDHTGYYIKIAADKHELALDLLSDMIWNSQFASEEIEKEKGVIVEEINMYRDNPTMYVEQLFEEAIYPNHSLGRNIAGTTQTVRSFDRNDLFNYYQNFYHPHNLTLIVAGKIEKNLNVKKFFGAALARRAKTKFVPFPKKQTAPVKIITSFKDTDQVHVALGWPAFSFDDPKSFALTVLNVILGATMSSRLFIEVREKRGLAYMVRSGINNYQDVGNLVIQAGLDKSRLEEALKVILEEVEKIKKYGVTAEELKMAKENIAGHLVLSLEDSSAQAEWFGRQALLMKKIMTPEERLKKYQVVSLANIQKVAKEIFQMPQLRLAVIGPYKDEKVLAKMLKI